MRIQPLTAAVACVVLACTSNASAQFSAPNEFEGFGESIQDLFSSMWVPSDRMTNSPRLRKAFRPVVADAREATVEVRSRGDRVAFGGIVGPDGWVVTKASLIRGPVTCRMGNGRELDARLVGVDSDADLAMLKLDAKGLPTLDLNGTAVREATQVVALRSERAVPTEEPDETSIEQRAPALSFASASEAALHAGDWLATVGIGHNPVAVGVVSVLPRPIEKRPGFLGVGLDLEYVPAAGGTAGVRIQTVSEDSAASEAGVAPGDLILTVNGAPTPTPKLLQKAIAANHPGDRIGLEVQRGEERLHLRAMLRGWAPNPAERRAYYQNNLGGKLSERRFGFPSAMQHDTVLEPDECGGPVVDLDGRVVGFNIARAGRTESYALPVEEVRSRLFDLMSGRLAPDDEDD